MSSSAGPNDAITARNREQSPLLRLPRELRDKIYHYVIGSGQVYIQSITYRRHVAFRGYPHLEFVPTVQLFTLSSICRQLHVETALLPFHWYLISRGLPYEAFGWPPRLSDEQRTAISQVQLDASALEYPAFVSFLADYDGLKSLTLRLSSNLTAAKNTKAIQLAHSMFGEHVHVNIQGMHALGEGI